MLNCPEVLTLWLGFYDELIRSCDFKAGLEEILDYVGWL